MYTRHLIMNRFITKTKNVLTAFFYTLAAIGLIDAIIQSVSEFKLIHFILGLFFTQ